MADLGSSGKGSPARDPSRAVNRPINRSINDWFIDVSPGAGVDNLLLESGNHLVLESDNLDALLLE